MEAKATRPEDVPGAPGSSTIGSLTVHRVFQALGTSEVQVNAIFFEPGARFRPHLHPYDQVLHYVKGTGVVALDGGEDQLVPEGEFVLLPAGVLHMHGATADGPAVHISTMRVADPGVETTDFGVAVPESWAKYGNDPGAS
jgi:quercetin dioxygenase-like cupin family protein